MVQRRSRGQIVTMANYYVTTVLEDAYEFLSGCMLTSILYDEDENSLQCDCIASPENFKFDPQSN